MCFPHFMCPVYGFSLLLNLIVGKEFATAIFSKFTILLLKVGIQLSIGFK